MSPQPKCARESWIATHCANLARMFRPLLKRSLAPSLVHQLRSSPSTGKNAAIAVRLPAPGAAIIGASAEAFAGAPLFGLDLLHFIALASKRRDQGIELFLVTGFAFDLSDKALGG